MTTYRNSHVIEFAATADLGENVETEIKILEVGPKEQRGGAGKFEVTAAHLAEMVKNHEADQAGGYQPPLVIGHPSKRDEAPAVGWLLGLRATAEGLFAKVQVLAEMAGRIRKGEFRHVSPTFTFSYTNEDGEAKGAKLIDLGVLNNPFQKALGAFALSAVDGETDLEIPMDSNKTPDDAGKITELTDRIQTLETEGAASVTSLAEKDAAIVALTEKLAEVTAKGLAEELKTIALGAVEAAALTPAQIEGTQADDLDAEKWLSDSPFDGIEGLKKFVATAAPVVDLGERKSADSGKDDGKGIELSEEELIEQARLAGVKPEALRETLIRLG